MVTSDPRLSIFVVTCVAGAESWIDGTIVAHDTVFGVRERTALGRNRYRQVAWMKKQRYFVRYQTTTSFRRQTEIVKYAVIWLKH